MSNVCPISFGQSKGEQNRLQHVRSMINSVPRATDLQSAIIALNMISNILHNLLRVPPVVNNVHLPDMAPASQQPGNVLNGTDYNPHYTKANWIEETRVYKPQKLYNYDDQSQFIDIKILSRVIFTNLNTNFNFDYHGAG